MSETESIHDVNDPPPDPISADAPTLARARVFVVDDHPLVRRGLAALIGQAPDLEICGEAPGHQEALSAITESRPDIVLVDISLRASNGLDLIKDIRSAQPALITLVISMHDETTYAERVLRAGARGYLMKSEANSTIVEAIRKVLKGEIYVSEPMAMRLLQRIAGAGPRQGGSPIDTLSDRELEVFVLIGGGMGTRQIAERLQLSPKTIEAHRAHIKKKLGLPTSAELIRNAIRWVSVRGEQRPDCPGPGE